MKNWNYSIVLPLLLVFSTACNASPASYESNGFVDDNGFNNGFQQQDLENGSTNKDVAKPLIDIWISKALALFFPGVQPSPSLSTSTDSIPTSSIGVTEENGNTATSTGYDDILRRERRQVPPETTTKPPATIVEEERAKLRKIAEEAAALTKIADDLNDDAVRLEASAEAKMEIYKNNPQKQTELLGELTKNLSEINAKIEKLQDDFDEVDKRRRESELKLADALARTTTPAPGR